jgi:DNA polymerase (family X)
MRSRPGVSLVTPASDFRRGCELIGDLSLVAQVSDVHGAVCIQEDQSQLALHLTDKQHYGAALLLVTGSEEHLKELREIAAAEGMTLDEEGLRKGDKTIASESEEAIYRALGLPFIEPELREGRGEITLERAGALASAEHSKLDRLLARVSPSSYLRGREVVFGRRKFLTRLSFCQAGD